MAEPGGADNAATTAANPGVQTQHTKDNGAPDSDAVLAADDVR